MKLITLMLSILLQNICSDLKDDIKIIPLDYRALSPTREAKWIGGKDKELRAPYKVHLRANFTLALVNGVLEGTLIADFVEVDPGPGHKYRGTDGTAFRTYDKYEIYRPQSGYEIIEFKILYDKEITSVFDCMGRNSFGPYEDVCEFGPLSALVWTGDTGTGEDQKNGGCSITPYLRRIEVKLKKINH